MKKIRTLLPGFGFFMVSEKGRDLDSGRSSAKFRACGEEYTPCAMVTLLAATQRSERWVSQFHLFPLQIWFSAPIFLPISHD
ncbi:hypothetical protein BJP22_14540 [Aeromonas veronii]|nr:hypothetical protein BJP22_14540 [Aeromonas veronii]